MEGESEGGSRDGEWNEQVLGEWSGERERERDGNVQTEQLMVKYSSASAASALHLLNILKSDIPHVCV